MDKIGVFTLRIYFKWKLFIFMQSSLLRENRFIYIVMQSNYYTINKPRLGCLFM